MGVSVTVYVGVKLDVGTCELVNVTVGVLVEVFEENVSVTVSVGVWVGVYDTVLIGPHLGVA